MHLRCRISADLSYRLLTVPLLIVERRGANEARDTCASLSSADCISAGEEAERYSMPVRRSLIASQLSDAATDRTDCIDALVYARVNIL